MKKIVAIAAVVLVVLSGCANLSHTQKCMGGGAVGGALVLGPVGAVAGAVAGHEVCK